MTACDLQQAVLELVSDKETPARKINVDVVDGIVTLRGEVNTAIAKDEADRVAKETEGRQVPRTTECLFPGAPQLFRRTRYFLPTQ